MNQDGAVGTPSLSAHVSSHFFVRLYRVAETREGQRLLRVEITNDDAAYC